MESDSEQPGDETRGARPWSRRALIGGVVASVGLLLTTLVVAKSALVLLLGGMFFAWGCSSSAALLLLALAVRRLRGGVGDAPWLRARDVALHAIIAGGGLLAGSLALTAKIGIGDGSHLAIAVGGLAVLVWGVVGLRRSAAGRPTNLALLLLACVAAVWIPRELGHFSIHLKHDNWQTKSNTQRNSRCSGTAGRTKRLRWQLTGRLRGDIGSILTERFTRARRQPAAVQVMVSGDLGIAGPACFLPLYRSASGRGKLSLVFDYDKGSARCFANVEIALSIEASSWGIGTCYDLRKAVAQTVLKELHKAVRGSL